MQENKEGTFLIQGFAPTKESGPDILQSCCLNPPDRGSKLTLKGVLRTFFAALFLYVLASGVSHVILWGESAAGEESVESYLSEDRLNSRIPTSQNALVHPTNGSHPTLTTTEECSGAFFCCYTEHLKPHPNNININIKRL